MKAHNADSCSLKLDGDESNTDHLFTDHQPRLFSIAFLLSALSGGAAVKKKIPNRLLNLPVFQLLSSAVCGQKKKQSAWSTLPFLIESIVLFRLTNADLMRTFQGIFKRNGYLENTVFIFG